MFTGVCLFTSRSGWGIPSPPPAGTGSAWTGYAASGTTLCGFPQEDFLVNHCVDSNKLAIICGELPNWKCTLHK